MKKWIIENLQDVRLAEDNVQRGDGEVKIKIAKVAFSSTDISYFTRGEGAVKVPGHSAMGYVSEADDDSGLKLGSRVVISPFVEYSEFGVKRVKVLGVDVDGLLTDFISVPQENVYALPDGVRDEDALFTEAIAFGIRIIEQMECEKGDYVVIVGASTLGLMLSQLALYYQMVPILVDMDSDKLKLAESWGVYYTLNPTYDNLERRVEEITGGRMSEFSVYVGEGVSFDATLRLVKDGGVAIIGGYSSTLKHKADMNEVLRKQLTLKGVCNGAGEMSSAINLLANKIIKTDGILNYRTDFDGVPQMIEDFIKYPYQYNKILVNID